MDLKQLIAFKQRLEYDYSSVKQVNQQLKSIVSQHLSSDRKNIVEPNIQFVYQSLILDCCHLEEQLTDPSTIDYDIYVSNTSTLNTKRCLGCSVRFAIAFDTKSLLRFNTHCIRECEKYKKLSLIVKCDNCQLLFVNKKSFSAKHRSYNGKCSLMSRHQNKPDWAPKSAKDWNQMHLQRRWNTSVSCIGCARTFKAFKNVANYTKVKEIAYYEHCFDECEEYKELDLICSCQNCGRKFLNTSSLALHSSLSGHSNRWLLTRKLNVCEGCGEKFDYGRSFDSEKFISHCVNDCSEYRKLGLIKKCTNCQKIFRNHIGLQNHLRTCLF